MKSGKISTSYLVSGDVEVLDGEGEDDDEDGVELDEGEAPTEPGATETGGPEGEAKGGE